MNEFEEKLKNYLIEVSAAVLDCPPENVFWEEDIDEFGFDSLKITQLCLAMNDHFSINIQPALFLEVTTLDKLGQFLAKNYYSLVENRLFQSA